MDSVRTGSSEVFVSPLVNENRSAEDILKSLDSIYNSNKSKVNEVLDNLEMLNRSKFGPMSIAKNWEDRKESLLDSYDYSGTIKRNSFAPYELWPKILRRLRPLEVVGAIGFLKNATNSGLPDYTKKKNVKDLYKSYTLSQISTVLKDLFNHACILFTRTQENGKTRNVWGFSIIMTIFEMCFYRPVLELQSKQSWRRALNTPDDINVAITKLIDTSISAGNQILSIDFSAYDNSVKSHLIKPAFESIKMLFQQKYWDYIDQVCYNFINVPIVTPDGVLTGPHGIPSGSTFTNEIDSIVQFGVARECNDIKLLELCQIQGDDGAYSVTSSEPVFEHFKSYGLKVNEDKSYVSSNWAIYLQQLFHADYRNSDGVITGIYPIYRALNRILFLERFTDFSDDGIKGSDYFSIRTISILEQCKHHPLFEDFVRLIWSLDKYNLSFSAQGLAAYIRRIADKEGKDLSFRNWTYGENVSGIKTFETFKLIQKFEKTSVDKEK